MLGWAWWKLLPRPPTMWPAAAYYQVQRESRKATFKNKLGNTSKLKMIKRCWKSRVGLSVVSLTREPGSMKPSASSRVSSSGLVGAQGNRNNRKMSSMLHVAWSCSLAAQFCWKLKHVESLFKKSTKTNQSLLFWSTYPFAKSNSRNMVEISLNEGSICPKHCMRPTCRPGPGSVLRPAGTGPREFCQACWYQCLRVNRCKGINIFKRCVTHHEFVNFSYGCVPR